jgi:hypothetical protein
MKKKFLIETYHTKDTLNIELSDVPRSGDWIKIEDKDFTNGEDYMKVKRVIFEPLEEFIVLIVDSI